MNNESSTAKHFAIILLLCFFPIYIEPTFDSPVLLFIYYYLCPSLQQFQLQVFDANKDGRLQLSEMAK